MHGIECPFFPGNVCTGSCDNHLVNEEHILEVAKEYHVDPETIMSSIRIDIFRNLRAKIASYNNPRIVFCDYNSQQ